jgi:hypothetical protein
MPYILYKSNGQRLVTVPDGSIESVSTDLTFVGKNYAGYGEILNQDLVKLLENFSNSNQPNKPLVGQLWYDTTSKRIKLYDGIRFKPLQNFDSSVKVPTDSSKGDLWFNEDDQRLYLFNGTKFLLIGPQESDFSGVALMPSSAITNNALTKYILKFTISDAFDTVVPAVVSRDEFTPNSIDTLSSESFNIIKKGISLPGANPITGSSISQDFYFWGTAATSLGMVEKTTGNYHQAEEYLLASTFTNALATGFSVSNDSGVLVGSGGVFRIHSDSGQNQAKLTGVNASSMSFNLLYKSTITNIITINGNSVVPNSTIGVNLGESYSKFSNVYANTVTSTMSYSNTYTGRLVGDIISSNGLSVILDNGTNGTDAIFTGIHKGNLVNPNITSGSTIAVDVSTTPTVFSGSFVSTNGGTFNGNIITTLISANPGDSDLNTGQIRGQWSLFGASTLSATYADLAERYHADSIYEYGTVLVIGGNHEVTISTTPADTRVAGIVSKNPAYMMNSEAGTDETHPYIALKGRVHCKVVGPIKKGDTLVTSTLAGYATSADWAHPAAIIGKALEDHSEGLGVIEVKV